MFFRIFRADRIGRVGWLGAVLALVLLAPLPVTADWLVLRDGREIETAGRWTTREASVTFKLVRHNGLFSLRLDEVDLDASDELTRVRAAAANRPKETAPRATAPRREPVLVLTDRDVRKVKRDRRTPVADADPPDDPPAAPVAAPQSLQPGLQVTSWRQSDDPTTGNIVVEGELRNTGRGLAIGLELTVLLTAGDGSVVAERAALLSSTTLAQHQRTRFRAEFPGTAADFDKVEFSLDPVGIAAVHILEPSFELYEGESVALAPGAAAVPRGTVRAA